MAEGGTVLRLDKVCKSFGGLQVLIDIDLKVEKEEIVGLIGPNGAGKSRSSTSSHPSTDRTTVMSIC